MTAAKLLGLDEEQMVNCLGSAGTQAAGLWEFLASGSMSKVLHTANANLCGLRPPSWQTGLHRSAHHPGGRPRI